MLESYEIVAAIGAVYLSRVKDGGTLPVSRRLCRIERPALLGRGPPRTAPARRSRSRTCVTLRMGLRLSPNNIDPLFQTLTREPQPPLAGAE